MASGVTKFEDAFGRILADTDKMWAFCKDFAQRVEAVSKTDLSIKALRNFLGWYVVIWPDGEQTTLMVNSPKCTPEEAASQLDAFRKSRRGV